jgi:hypothetical protein
MPTLLSAPAVQQRRPRTGPTLLLAAAGPVVTGYAAVAAVLALMTATAPGATLTAAGVLRAAGYGWLALYHVPIDIGDHELGMLPLLPTALVLTLVARSAGNAAYRLEWDTPRQARHGVTAVAVTHAVAATGIALISDAASPVAAFFVAGVLAAVAALVGLATPCGLLDAALARADHVTVAGLRAGRLAVVGMVAAGAVVFGVAMIASWSTVVHLFAVSAPDLGSGFGMFLLSVAFLPNVLIGTLSFAAGPGVAIGQVVLAQWHFHGGAVPAVPVLAPLPTGIGDWWLFLMLLPAAVGVLAGLTCCRIEASIAGRFRAVGVAALVTGVTWLVLAALAGGALAGGPFDPVTVPAGALAVATCLLVGVPGGLTVWIAGRREPEPEPGEQEPDEDDEDSPVHEAETGTA